MPCLSLHQLSRQQQQQQQQQQLYMHSRAKVIATKSVLDQAEKSQRKREYSKPLLGPSSIAIYNC